MQRKELGSLALEEDEGGGRPVVDPDAAGLEVGDEAADADLLAERVGQVGEVDVTSLREWVARGSGRGGRPGAGGAAGRPRAAPGSGGRGGSGDTNVGRVAREDRESLVRGGRVWPADDAGHGGDAVFRQRVGGDPGTGLADDDDLPPAEPDLGPPAVAELVHAGHWAVDPDELPLVTFPGLRSQDQRSGGSAAAAEGDLRRLEARRAIRALHRAFDMESGRDRRRGCARREEDLDGRAPVLDHDPPPRGVEQGRRRGDDAIDGHRALTLPNGGGDRDRLRGGGPAARFRR